MNSPALGQARIDAHQHFWRRARGDYAWLRADDASLAPLLRDFAPADLAPLMAASGVTRTVLVQAADTTAETDYLLSLADEHEQIAGVVGWIDLSRRESIHTLEAWAERPKLKSVRPMLQDLPQPDWIAHAPHPEVVRALVRLGLRFDALVKPPHLGALLELARRHPQLAIVLDHGAKPPIAGGDVSAWKRDVARLARETSMVCKLSGLVTEANCADRAALQDCVDHLLDCFGPARLMWGSDWPVCELVCSYADWRSTTEQLLARLGDAECELIYSETARKTYGI